MGSVGGKVEPVNDCATPVWLADIRKYWTEFTQRLADESGRPNECSPSNGAPEADSGADDPLQRNAAAKYQREESPRRLS